MAFIKSFFGVILAAILSCLPTSAQNITGNGSGVNSLPSSPSLMVTINAMQPPYYYSASAQATTVNAVAQCEACGGTMRERIEDLAAL